MQVRKQHVLGSQQVVFRRGRLLPLDDQLGAPVQGRCIRQNLYALRAIGTVRITALLSGPGLYVHLTPGAHQFPGGFGYERHTPFEGFDFLWNTDTHACSFRRCPERLRLRITAVIIALQILTKFSGSCSWPPSNTVVSRSWAPARPATAPLFLLRPPISTRY